MRPSTIFYILSIALFLSLGSGCRSGESNTGNGGAAVAGGTDAGQMSDTPTPVKTGSPSAPAGQGNSNVAEPAQKIDMPAAKSPGVAVCAEGAGGNGLEIKDADFAHMQAAHAAVLKRWLCFQKVNMRPAREEQESAESQRYFKRDHPTGDPFYAVGDFNKNGAADFAVVLDFFAPKLSAEKRALKALAIFEMSPPKTGDKPVAAFFTDEVDPLSIIGTNKEYGLWLGSYPSDDGVIFIPKGDGYVVKAMME